MILVTRVGSHNSDVHHALLNAIFESAPTCSDCIIKHAIAKAKAMDIKGNQETTMASNQCFHFTVVPYKFPCSFQQNMSHGCTIKSKLLSYPVWLAFSHKYIISIVKITGSQRILAILVFSYITMFCFYITSEWCKKVSVNCIFKGNLSDDKCLFSTTPQRKLLQEDDFSSIWIGWKDLRYNKPSPTFLCSIEVLYINTFLHTKEYNKTLYIAVEYKLMQRKIVYIVIKINAKQHSASVVNRCK